MASHGAYIFIPMLQIEVCLSCIRQGYVSLRHWDKILSCGGCQRIIQCESREEESSGSFIVCDMLLFCGGATRQGMVEELGSQLSSCFYPPRFLFSVLKLHNGFLKAKKVSS